jgi:hypothetical protein
LRRSSIHHLRALQVAFERLVFPFVPMFTHFLSQVRSVANHPFDEIVGHLEPCLGPVAAMTEIPPPEPEGQGHPAQQEERLEPTSSTDAENRHCHDEFDPRYQSEQPTAESQGFHRLRLNDTSEELASTLGADLLRLQP